MPGLMIELPPRDLEMIQTRVLHAPPEQILTSVDFEATGPRETRLTVTQRFDTNADRNANIAVSATAGRNDSFEQMDELLAAP